MSSLVNSSNPSKRWSCFFSVIARCCPCRARSFHRQRASLEVRVGESANRALPSVPSNENPLLTERVSLVREGGEILELREIAPIRVLISSSEDLLSEQGVEFTEDELGRTLRSTSIRSSEYSFSCSSPLLGFITSRTSFEKYTPPPKRSGEYDFNKYYGALGEGKGLEDFPFCLERSSSFKKASGYLASILPTSGDFLIDSYMHVNMLLLERKDPLYRTEKIVSFCLVPKEYVWVSYPCETRKQVPTIFEEEGMGLASFFGTIKDITGNCYYLYEMDHSLADIPEKLHRYIEDFNHAIEFAEAGDSAHGEAAKFDAIILFFIRCEQLQPVQESRRTNLAVLNYLLAKYNFPCFISQDQIVEIGGKNVSRLNYLSFDHLRIQVIEGMKGWCEKAGISYSC